MKRIIRNLIAGLPLVALLATTGAATLSCASVRSGVSSAVNDAQDRHERAHERHKRMLGID